MQAFLFILFLNTSTHTLKNNKLIQFLLLVFLIIWGSTFIGTNDYANWFLENVLVFVSLPVLIFTYKKFQFSKFSYVLICIYLCLHVYGSKYTYAENPLGYWIKNIFNLERNHYDRIVHFSFGLLLSFPLRDYFLNYLKWPVWVTWVLPCEIILSFSGMYEIIEWLVAEILFTDLGPAYLGIQGDVWDAQKDMALALSGAIISMLCGVLVKKIIK